MAVWTIVTLCLEVCHVSISTYCKVFRIPLLVFFTNHRKYAHVTSILKKFHWLLVKYRCIFKTATLVYKFLHSGSPSYFEPFLSLSCSPYSTRHSHPDRQYLIQFLLSTHQSLSQSNILAIVLPLMLLRSGMNSLMMCSVQHQLPPSERSSKLTCL